MLLLSSCHCEALLCDPNKGNTVIINSKQFLKDRACPSLMLIYPHTFIPISKKSSWQW